MEIVARCTKRRLCTRDPELQLRLFMVIPAIYKVYFLQGRHPGQSVGIDSFSQLCYILEFALCHRKSRLRQSRIVLLNDFLRRLC